MQDRKSGWSAIDAGLDGALRAAEIPDNYRAGVQRLVQNRVGRSSKARLRRARADGNLLRQLEQSLEPAERKPSAASPVSPMPATDRKEP